MKQRINRLLDRSRWVCVWRSGLARGAFWVFGPDEEIALADAVQCRYHNANLRWRPNVLLHVRRPKFRERWSGRVRVPNGKRMW